MCDAHSKAEVVELSATNNQGSQRRLVVIWMQWWSDVDCAALNRRRSLSFMCTAAADYGVCGGAVRGVRYWGMYGERRAG